MAPTYAVPGLFPKTMTNTLVGLEQDIENVLFILIV